METLKLQAQGFVVRIGQMGTGLPSLLNTGLEADYKSRR
jgi:hypothetical protein